MGTESTIPAAPQSEPHMASETSTTRPFSCIPDSKMAGSRMLPMHPWMKIGSA